MTARQAAQGDSSALAAAVIAIAALVTALAAWFSSGQATRSDAPRESAAIILPDRSLPVAAFSTLGSSTAPLALIVFSNFQCKYCGQFARLDFQRFKTSYVSTDQLLIAFVHLPLPSTFRAAAIAAEAAECAGNQGAFWRIHDYFFNNQPRITTEGIRDLVGEAGGVVSEQFELCMAGAMKPRLREQLALASELGVESTPTFVLGKLADGTFVQIGTRFAGLGSIPALEAAIATLRVQSGRIIGGK